MIVFEAELSNNLALPAHAILLTLCVFMNAVLLKVTLVLTQAIHTINHVNGVGHAMDSGGDIDILQGGFEEISLLFHHSLLVDIKGESLEGGELLLELLLVLPTSSSIAISFLKSTIAVMPVAVALHANPHIQDCGHCRPCRQRPACPRGRCHRILHPLPLRQQSWWACQLIVILFMTGCRHYHHDAYPPASSMLASHYPPLCPMSYPSFFTPLAPRGLTWHTIVG